MHVEIARIPFIIHQSAERTGSLDLLTQGWVRTLFTKPVAIVVTGIVHGTARFADHAAQRQILETGTKASEGMPFNMGEIYQEAGILDHTGYFPDFDILI